MIDLHSHLLPGVDDGPRDLDTSLRLAEALSRAGVTVVAATPHVSAEYPTTAEEVVHRVAALRAELDRAGVQLTLLPGAELDYEELDRPDEELASFGLGGNPRLLLVETPYAGFPLDLPARLLRLQEAGFTVVLAHPERNPGVQRRPEILEGVVAAGSVVQLTAGSLAGELGREPRRAALDLLALGLAHTVASDAHAPEGRALGPAAVEAAVGDEALAAWLTHDVPAALLERRPWPERPPGR